MTDIYDQHSAAFSAVASFAVLDKRGTPVATVAFKYPRDGAGRLYCYLHVIGSRMARGHASGGGYDKHSAAFEAALAKIEHNGPGVDALARDQVLAFRDAMEGRGGHYWNNNLERAGYRVFQTV